MAHAVQARHGRYYRALGFLFGTIAIGLLVFDLWSGGQLAILYVPLLLLGLMALALTRAGAYLQRYDARGDDGDAEQGLRYLAIAAAALGATLLALGLGELARLVGGDAELGISALVDLLVPLGIGLVFIGGARYVHPAVGGGVTVERG
jgi:hypothetical protein